MPTDDRNGPRAALRPRIAAKFLVTLGVLVPAIVALAWIAVWSLGSLQRESRTLYEDNVRTSQLSAQLGRALGAADEAALQLVPTTDRSTRDRLNTELDRVTIPAVDGGIETLRRVHANDPAVDRALVERIATGWRRFLGLRSTGVLDADRVRDYNSRYDEALALRLAAIFDPITAIAREQIRVEERQGSRAFTQASEVYGQRRTLLYVIALGTLVAAVGAMLWLIRDIVPRIRAYSAFAERVSAGELAGRLRPRGHDEIAQLGGALDRMVERRESQQHAQAAQHEFIDMLQATASEEEAHELLKRQLERTVAGGSAVVLNRNNSANRLNPTTALAAGDGLAEKLADAEPRSCLAVRFARPHQEGPEHQPLAPCEICGQSAAYATCKPLIVSGEVIGSVLVHHPEALRYDERAAVRETVAQAAPVLGNLRNLALAEFRAATDALTGLSNSRAARDTLKRMAAQASRTISPLAALLVDLDHFKQINDRFGHGPGDDVLAAVGPVLQSATRDSDFVGRYGGEEFLILLPDTGREEAHRVAENVRIAVAAVTVPSVERAITASIGVAVLPDDAGDPTTLLRHADRALYVAKENGRNRVEVAGAPGAWTLEPLVGR